MDTELKICTKCKVQKPKNPEYFYRNKAAKDGFTYQCIACLRNTLLIYRERFRERWGKEKLSGKEIKKIYNLSYYTQHRKELLEKLREKRAAKKGMRNATDNR